MIGLKGTDDYAKLYMPAGYLALEAHRSQAHLIKKKEKKRNQVEKKLQFEACKRFIKGSFAVRYS